MTRLLSRFLGLSSPISFPTGTEVQDDVQLILHPNGAVLNGSRQIGHLRRGRFYPTEPYVGLGVQELHDLAVLAVESLEPVR